MPLHVLAALSALLAMCTQAADLRQALEAEHDHHRHARRSHRFRHRLRVCNAYPYSSAMDVYIRGGDKLTDEQPMQYKSCRDFVSNMQAGDKVDFKVGEVSAGTFSVSDLPNNDAILLLVIYRHDTLTTAVSFQSHVFANLLNAQLAIIDTYKGVEHATPRIMDVLSQAPDGQRRSEELRFNSVVAVNPGIYELELHGQDHAPPKVAPLVALNRESYVVLRTGVEAQQGPSFPEEIIIYPKSDPTRLSHSGAPRQSPGVLGFAMSLVIAFVTATPAWCQMVV